MADKNFRSCPPDCCGDFSAMDLWKVAILKAIHNSPNDLTNNNCLMHFPGFSSPLHRQKQQNTQTKKQDLNQEDKAAGEHGLAAYLRKRKATRAIFTTTAN